MIKIINAKTARNNFSAMIDTAMKNNQVIVTRFNRPAVVITSFKDFNPKDTMSKKKWQEGFEKIEELREKAQKFPQEKVDQMVEGVIKNQQSKNHKKRVRNQFKYINKIVFNLPGT